MKEKRPVFHDSERAGLLAVLTAICYSQGRGVPTAINTAQDILSRVEEIETQRMDQEEGERQNATVG